jgi:hypothetical protein
MIRTTLAPAAAAACLSLLAATAAHAGTANRAWVSGHGTDSAGCGAPTAPCRSFQYVITNVIAPGGEIDVLDPAGYGALTIPFALSIVNDGVGTAGIQAASGGTGVTVAALPSADVSLRGLTIEGASIGETGIAFTTGRSLTIENCVVRHFAADGIDLDPSASGNFAISNTLVADNTGDGILVLPTGAGTVTAMFNRVELSSNGSDGLLFDGQSSTGTLNAAVFESVATHHTNTGFYAFTAIGKAPTTLSVFQSVSANNDTGLEATGPGATLIAAHSMISGNADASWGIASSGVIASYGDNYFAGNGPNNTGLLTMVSKQ